MFNHLFYNVNVFVEICIDFCFDMLSIIVGINKLESARIGIGRSHFQEIGIGASLSFTFACLTISHDYSTLLIKRLFICIFTICF